MMIKNRVKTNQTRLDRYYRYTSELEMIKSERMFLETLGCLPEDKLKDYGKLSIDYLNQSRPYLTRLLF